MKYLLLTTVFAILSASIFAQEQNTELQFKNKFMVGGNLNLDVEHNNSRDFTIRPLAGYFINNKFAIGLALEYRAFDKVNYGLDQNNHPDFPGSVIATGNSLAFAPFVTYQNKIANRIYYNLTASFGYEASGKLETEDYEEMDDSHYNYTYGKLQAGISFFLSNVIALDVTILDFELGKYKEKFIYETDNSITKFNYNIIQPNIGLVFYL